MFRSDGSSLVMVALVWARFGDTPQCWGQCSATELGTTLGAEHGGAPWQLTLPSISAAAVAMRRNARERGSLHPSLPWQPCTGMESSGAWGMHPSWHTDPRRGWLLRHPQNPFWDRDGRAASSGMSAQSSPAGAQNPLDTARWDGRSILGTAGRAGSIPFSWERSARCQAEPPAPVPWPLTPALSPPPCPVLIRAGWLQIPAPSPYFLPAGETVMQQAQAGEI